MFAEAIAEYQAAVEARAREELLAQLQPPAETRRRRLRITGGEGVDLSGAIDEHKETARERRTREAESTGLDWLFEETLVLPEDFGKEPDVADEQEFDFDAAEGDLLTR